MTAESTRRASSGETSGIAGLDLVLRGELKGEEKGSEVREGTVVRRGAGLKSDGGEVGSASGEEGERIEFGSGLGFGFGFGSWRETGEKRSTSIRLAAFGSCPAAEEKVDHGRIGRGVGVEDGRSGGVEGERRCGGRGIFSLSL